MGLLIELSAVQTLLAITAVFVAWISTLAVFAFRMGRFEANAATKSELNLAIKDNQTAIEKVETGVRDDLKDMRKDMQTRLDGLFREIVRK
jgi:hypothetical protein